MITTGRMSVFGGPHDLGVRRDEGLALIGSGEYESFKDVLLKEQPPGTTGMARRLNPAAFYIAMRWEYWHFPRAYLRNIHVTVTNPKNGKSRQARPVDWGPAERTGRIADLSPGLADALGLETNDICSVHVPLPPASS